MVIPGYRRTNRQMGSGDSAFVAKGTGGGGEGGMGGIWFIISCFRVKGRGQLTIDNYQLSIINYLPVLFIRGVGGEKQFVTDVADHPEDSQTHGKANEAENRSQC